MVGVCSEFPPECVRPKGITVFYYKFHVGDYASHTAHLTPLEDIAYRRLLDLYYQREEALIGSPEHLARIIRMREHADVVDVVLREFFVEEDSDNGDNPTSVWRNKRCDAEIDGAKDRKRKSSEAGKASAAARSTDVQRTLNDRSTEVQPSITHNPLPTTQDPLPKTQEGNTQRGQSKNNRKSAAALAVIPRPDDVSEATWDGWQALRKAKRAPITAGVISTMRAEAMKASITLEAALQTCCLRGWAGFKADWMTERRQSATERAAEAVARLTGQRDHERGITYIEHDDEISF
jgi:uncharacterized protein YdaU (DUF1376 family)